MWRLLHKAGWLAGVVLMLWLVADLHGPTAWASPRRMTGFHHRMWTPDNGIGAVFDIQQASNGYLWLTTSSGVFRFDGVRFQSIEEATNGALQNSEVHSAFLSSSGGVWLERALSVPQSLAVWPHWSLPETAKELPAVLGEWTRLIATDDLSRDFAYTNTKGQQFSNRLSDVTLHVAFHGVYHRGQIAALVRQQGGEPAYTDFIQGVRTGAV